MTRSFADMPKDCQHIRHKVRTEYYNTVDELMSVYHMSYDQAISAVVIVGKRMFGLDWRMFEEGDLMNFLNNFFTISSDSKLFSIPFFKHKKHKFENPRTTLSGSALTSLREIV